MNPLCEHPAVEMRVTVNGALVSMYVSNFVIYVS